MNVVVRTRRNNSRFHLFMFYAVSLFIFQPSKTERHTAMSRMEFAIKWWHHFSLINTKFNDKVSLNYGNDYQNPHRLFIDVYKMWCGLCLRVEETRVHAMNRNFDQALCCHMCNRQDGRWRRIRNVRSQFVIWINMQIISQHNSTAVDGLAIKRTTKYRTKNRKLCAITIRLDTNHTIKWNQTWF